MSGNFYDNPVEVTYSLNAFSLSTAGTARLPRVASRSARVRGFGYRVSTATTVAAASLGVRPFGGSALITLSVPVSAINSVGSATKAQLEGAAQSDVDLEVFTDGGATAGAADVFLTVGYF